VPESTASALVSVIIPCFNVEQYIKECLDSVFDQKHPEIEIICVDDGSTDATVAILETYRERIRLISQGHRGAASARNSGLKQANGEFIQFLDADDLLLPDKIFHQVALFTDNPEACFIAGQYRRMAIDGSFFEPMLGRGDPWRCLAVSCAGITSSNFWKKSILQSIGGWNEAMKSSQEAELMFRILQRHQVVLFDPMPLTIVRERENGAIHSKNPVRYSIRYMNLRLAMLNYLESVNELSRDRKEMMSLSLLGRTRYLGNTNNKVAMLYYSKYLDGRLDLENNSQLHPLYRLFLRMIGFPAAEHIARAVRQFLPFLDRKQGGSRLWPSK